jgi:hypothetical protein
VQLQCALIPLISEDVANTPSDLLQRQERFIPQTTGDSRCATRPYVSMVEAETGESRPTSSNEETMIAAHRNIREVIAEADIQSIFEQ